MVLNHNNRRKAINYNDMTNLIKNSAPGAKVVTKVDINDPAFQRPLSELNRQYTGTVKLITKIKPQS